MKISITLPAMAPQPTGHPASLPPDPPKPSPAQQVEPPGEGAASGDSDSGHRTAEDEPKSVPPSIMQIKITEILEQQAEERDQPPETGRAEDV